MDAPRDNVIAFPARDAGSAEWHARAMENGSRTAGQAVAEMADSSAALADSAIAQARLAEDARELMALLARLTEQLDELRRCGAELQRG